MRRNSPPWYPEQWEDDDFEPVRCELDTLMESLGMARPLTMRVLWGAPDDASVPVKRTTRRELTKLYGGDELRVGFLLSFRKRKNAGDVDETVVGRRSRGELSARTKRPSR